MGPQLPSAHVTYWSCKRCRAHPGITQTSRYTEYAPNSAHMGAHIYAHVGPRGSTRAPRAPPAAAPGRRWICQPDGARKKTVVAHRRAKEQRRWRHRRRSAKSALPSVRASDVGFLQANRAVNADKCKPAKCRQECKRSCPVVRMGTCAEVGAFAVWLTRFQGAFVLRWLRPARSHTSARPCALGVVSV